MAQLLRRGKQERLSVSPKDRASSSSSSVVPRDHMNARHLPRLAACQHCSPEPGRRPVSTLQHRLSKTPSNNPPPPLYPGQQHQIPGYGFPSDLEIGGRSCALELRRNSTASPRESPPVVGKLVPVQFNIRDATRAYNCGCLFVTTYVPGPVRSLQRCAALSGRDPSRRRPPRLRPLSCVGSRPRRELRRCR